MFRSHLKDLNLLNIHPNIENNVASITISGMVYRYKNFVNSKKNLQMLKRVRNSEKCSFIDKKSCLFKILPYL